MDTLEILKAGRELISDPARWTQNVTARDAQDDWAFASDQDAVCWCSLGALLKIGGSGYQDAIDALDISALQLGSQQATLFNDTHTHAEVLAMWDRAIAAESAKVAP